VRGHLLNEKLGGPAQWPNLTPITQEANNRSAESMLHNFERAVKTAVNDNGKAVNFSVTANYGQKARGGDIAQAKTRLSGTKRDDVVAIMTTEQLIPRSLDCVAFELKADGTRMASPVARFTVSNEIDTDVDTYRT
jgi:hypothetical protein